MAVYISCTVLTLLSLHIVQTLSQPALALPTHELPGSSAAGANFVASAQLTPKKGPLSYLSTVTTASNSDWGSQSLQRLSPQPSAVVQQPSGLVQQPSDLSHQPSDLAQQPSGLVQQQQSPTTTATPQQNKPSFGSHRGSEEMHQPATSSQHQANDAAMLNDMSNRGQARQASQAASATLSDAQAESAPPNQAQGDAQLSSWAAGGTNWDASNNSLNLTPAATPQDSNSQGFSRNSLNNALPVSQTDSHQQSTVQDWSAFGQNDEPQAQPSAALHPAHQQTQNSSANLHQPSFEASFAVDDWLGSTQEAQQHTAGSDPAFDADFSNALWPASSQASQQQDTGGPHPSFDGEASPPQRGDELAHMGSGDSFGDFNTPEEHAGGQEVDWAAAPAMPADPFAASASFKDFAALLETNSPSTINQRHDSHGNQQEPSAPRLQEVDLAELQSDSVQERSKLPFS